MMKGEPIKKLVELRKKFNYSHADMGKMLNISKTYYWQLENGNRRLYYHLAVKIADIFKLKPDDLFFEEK